MELKLNTDIPELFQEKLKKEEHQGQLTRLEEFGDGIILYLSIPMPGNPAPGQARFAVYLEPECAYIYLYNPPAKELLEEFFEHYTDKEQTMERFLYDLLEFTIAGDLLYLNELETSMTELEDSALSKRMEDCNPLLMPIRKMLLYRRNYYEQYIVVAERLEDNEQGLFEDTRLFSRFSERLTRLSSYTQLLREYSIQIRELYQTQIDVRQNKTMQMLTVVTTIFMPLTLITGWYGMNFEKMPELGWDYGYPVIIVISIIIVIILIFIFRRKRYL